MNRGMEFQSKVFELVTTKLKNRWPGSTLSISDSKLGPIDIIATVKRTGDNLALAGEAACEIEEKIFVECKDHASKLGLDVTGKAYCVALAQQPNYLIIVSRKGLEPQALKFAARLFRCKGITNLVLDNRNNYTQTPLSSIDFLHYTLDELEATTTVTVSDNTDKVRFSRFSDTSPSFSLNSWYLKEERQAHDDVANSNTPLDQLVFLKSDRSYYLEILIEIKGHSSKMQERQIALKLGKDSLSSISPLGAQTDLETFLSIDFYLNNHQIQKLAKEKSISIHITGKSDNIIIHKKIPRLESINNIEIFENLRPKIENHAFEELKPNSRSSCMIVEGFSGCGKSYLCYNLIQRLGHEYGFVSKNFHLSRRDPSVFLIQLSLTIFDFVRLDDLKENDIFCHNLLTAYLKKFVPFGDFATNTDTSSVLNTPLEELPLDILISLTARCIDVLKTPYVFWFQDCQDASPEMIYAMDRLCNEISLDSWYKFRFFFEYRNEAPLQTAWQEFKTSRASNTAVGCHFVTIMDLSPNDVRQSLSKLFAPTLVHEITLSLIKKTGGNPLYMDHVLRHFISRGYMQITPKTGEYIHFHVLDIGGIRDELDYIDESTIQFLLRRLSFLLGQPDRSNRLIEIDSARQLIWLQALSPQPPETSQLMKTLDIERSRLHSIIHALVAERILSDSSLHGSLNFIHDLIRLAASKMPVEIQEVSKLAHNLALNSQKSEPKDCLNVGIAMYQANRLQEAEQWLQAGYECSAQTDFYFQRLILSKLDKVLERIGQQIIQDKAKWIDVKMSLGWAELQGGSLIDAKHAYRSAEKLCLWPFDPSDQNACRIEKAFRLKALHLVATVDVELLEILSSFRSLQYVFETTDDINLLFHTSNRFLLGSMYANQPKTGLSVAPFCLALSKASTSLDALSVVMSDLGSFYFAEHPKIAAKLWEYGLSAAVEKRQITHSRLNQLVEEIVIDHRFSEKKYKELETEIILLKLDAQLPRMELIRGIGAFISGDLTVAEHFFSAAIKRAIRHNQTLMRWLATFNLIACNLASNKEENLLRDLIFLEQELNSINIFEPKILAQGSITENLFREKCNYLSISPFYQYKNIYLPKKLSTTGPLISLYKEIIKLKILIENNKTIIKNSTKKSNSHVVSVDGYSCIIY